MEAVLSNPRRGAASDGGWLFSLSPMGDRAQLERDWRSLEADSCASFFLSWDWMGCWLDHLPQGQHPRVLRVEQAGRLLGLALLIPRRRRWLGLLPADELYLHETGDAALDALTIEYNGVLAPPALREELTAHAVAWLLASRQADELHLPGIPASALDRIDTRRFATRLRDRKPTYAVNLDAVRDAGSTFAATLSANTRAQMRRALRQFTALGEPRLVAAGTAQEALAMFESMIPLHQAYWQGKGHAGAFAIPTFAAFHRQLIGSGFDRGCVQVLRCEAGTSVVGYLYNFIAGTRVYSYQSGFDYALLPRSKPGWLCHHLAIEHNLRHGMSSYDLLAGKSQFKASFARPADRLVWVTVEQAGWRPSLMSHLRAAKQCLRKQSHQPID